MHEIWFSHGCLSVKLHVEIPSLMEARQIWDLLDQAEFQMISRRP